MIKIKKFVVISAGFLLISAWLIAQTNDQVYANAVVPPAKGECKKAQKCNTLGNATADACPTILTPSGGYCVFDASTGDITWCSGDEGNCTIDTKNGITPQWCVGYCQRNSALSCESTRYSKCK